MRTPLSARVQYKATDKQERSLSEEELARFNNELKGAFKDMLEQVEQSQAQAVNGLSQKQTEMF